MAECKINPAVTETKVIEVSPETITLTLTRDEAEYLQTVLARTNGRTLYNVFSALQGAGIKYLPWCSRLPMMDVHSSKD